MAPVLSKSNDQQIYLSALLTKVTTTTHTGVCGYMCLAVATGRTSWIEIVRWFVSVKESKFISVSQHAMICKLEKFMEDCDWETGSLPDELYLSVELLDVFATLQSIIIVIFKACEDSAGYNAIDIAEGSQPEGYRGISIALLLHGKQNNMFELLEADDEKQTEFDESMASVIGVMRERKKHFEKSIRESSDGRRNGGDKEEEEYDGNDEGDDDDDDDDLQNDGGGNEDDDDLHNDGDGDEEEEEDDDDDECELRTQYEELHKRNDELPKSDESDFNDELLECDEPGCVDDIYDRCENCFQSFCRAHLDHHTYCQKDEDRHDESEQQDRHDESEQQDRHDESEQQGGPQLTMDDLGSGDEQEDSVASTEQQADMFASLANTRYHQLFNGTASSQEHNVGGNKRMFVKIPRKDSTYHSTSDSSTLFTDASSKKIPPIYFYRPVASFRSGYREIVSQCNYVNDETGQLLLLLQILQTQCGRLHYLVWHNAKWYHFRDSNATIDGLCLKGFRHDVTEPVDLDQCIQLTVEYFETYGPYGKLSEIADPKKMMPWVFDKVWGAPIETKKPYAFSKYLHTDEDVEHDQDSAQNPAHAAAEAPATAATEASAMAVTDSKSKKVTSAVKDREFANASYAFLKITSLAHKLCTSIYYYDVYRSLRNGKVLHETQFGNVIYVKRLSAFNGRFLYAGAFYLHVSKKPKMYHFVYDRDYGSMHVVSRSHVVKPLPAESNNSDDHISAIVDHLRRIAHHVSIHRCIPDLPDIHIAVMADTADTTPRKVSFGANPIRRSQRKRSTPIYSEDEYTTDFDSDDDYNNGLDGNYCDNGIDLTDLNDGADATPQDTRSGCGDYGIVPAATTDGDGDGGSVVDGGGGGISGNSGNSGHNNLRTTPNSSINSSVISDSSIDVMRSTSSCSTNSDAVRHGRSRDRRRSDRSRSASILSDDVRGIGRCDNQSSNYRDRSVDYLRGTPSHNRDSGGRDGGGDYVRGSRNGGGGRDGGGDYVRGSRNGGGRDGGGDYVRGSRNGGGRDSGGSDDDGDYVRGSRNGGGRDSGGRDGGGDYVRGSRNGGGGRDSGGRDGGGDYVRGSRNGGGGRDGGGDYVRGSRNGGGRDSGGRDGGGRDGGGDYVRGSRNGGGRGGDGDYVRKTRKRDRRSDDRSRSRSISNSSDNPRGTRRRGSRRHDDRSRSRSMSNGSDHRSGSKSHRSASQYNDPRRGNNKMPTSSSWNNSHGVDFNGVPRRMCAPMAGGEFHADVQKFSKKDVSHMLELASNMEQMQRMQCQINVQNRENIVKNFFE
jgi:hypothetical protein